MPAGGSALEAGDPDGDGANKASRLAARAARFSQKLPGNRYKELEEMRIKERKVFEQQGLIKVGKTELGDAVDMRGTCERMCSEYEREFREYTREVHPFEAGPNKRMEPEKAVAAYSRSDAGAGHGDSAILPSDLRTPRTLVQTLDYLFSIVMPTLPPSTSTSTSTPRKALGYSAGFIRDRTRAIRKEFAMQSSWGHQEAIASFERIARWHILCLRELQEESGTNSDMHIDSAELGRCFVSLRQHYNDRREELGVESPCPNEPEFRAYMLIYDLNSKSVSIPISELPSAILDHPLVKLAWEIRRAAQRNFDSQKEGSKANSELGMNLINRFVKLLKQQRIPYLMSCLVEIRLREMRRSAIRALTRTYPRLRADPIRINEVGEVVERRMLLIKTLDKILGCEAQDEEESAWDDIDPISRNPDQEAVAIAKKFGIEVYEDASGPVGALVNLGAPYNDNRDAPYTRRWKSISEKKGSASYVDVVNGRAGVHIDGSQKLPAPARLPTTPSFTFASSAPAHAPAPTHKQSAFSFAPVAQPPAKKAQPSFLTPDHPTPAKLPEGSSSTPFFPPPDNPDRIAPKGVFPSPSENIFAAGDDKTRLFSPKPSSAAQYSDSAIPAAPGPISSTSFSFAPPTQAVKSDEVRKKKKRTAEDDVPPAKTPLFSQPALFTGPAAPVPPPSPAGASTSNLTTATLPPFSVPKPLLPASPAHPSTVSPRAKKRSASSLLSSTSSSFSSSSSVLNRSLAKSHDERSNRVSALPDVCDLLIEEVIQSMIEDHLSVDLGRLVKQQKAATDYQQRKMVRAEAIHHWTESTFDRLLSAQTRRVAEAAIMAEVKRRYLVRRAVTFWRTWAKTKRENRELADKKRETMYTHLHDMGLSRSRSVVSRSETGTPLSDIDMSLEAERLDSLQIDIEINHAERTKDNFFAPSTFLLALTRHIGPLLSFDFHQSTSTCDALPAFQTILSVPPDDFGSPPDDEVTQWLITKFSPPHQKDVEDHGDNGEKYESDGVEYDTHVLRQGKALPRWNSVGLFVFEAPLRTDDDRKAAENIADAQDRIGALVKSLEGDGNKYTPSLLVMTWEEESLDDLVERLDIKREIATFEHRSIISLQLSDDLDARFTDALLKVIPEVTSKEQVVIEVEDVINVAYPLWSRFADIAGLSLLQRPDDSDLAGDIFKIGINLINELPKLAKSVLGAVGSEEKLDFEAVQIPPFPAENGDLPFELVERIAEYLEDDQLKGIDDLDILLAPMRQAALLGHALPLIPALINLSFLVWGEMKHRFRHIPLDVFFMSDQSIRRYFNDYLLSVKSGFESVVDESVARILPNSKSATKADGPRSDRMDVDSTHLIRKTTNTTQTLDDQDGHNDIFAPSFYPQSHVQEGINTPSPTRKKRSRSGSGENPSSSTKIVSPSKTPSKKESNARKNARLLRALRDVERTLNMAGVESDDSHQSQNQVSSLDIGVV